MGTDKVGPGVWGDSAPPRLPQDYFRRPSPARMWNYLLGGKDNYPLDQGAGNEMAKNYPAIFDMARQVRLFLTRGVKYLAEAGVHQFLDIGCGLPAPHPFQNTHEVANEVFPGCRVVYADSDVVVMAHARALLNNRLGPGATDYVESDIRKTEDLLEEASRTLDFGQPIAVLLLGVLGAVSYDEALHAVATIKNAVPSGSYLLHEDGVALSPERKASVDRRNETGMNRYELRSPEQLARFYADWELVEPGHVSVAHWRPTVIEADRPLVEEFGALARKP